MMWYFEDYKYRREREALELLGLRARELSLITEADRSVTTFLLDEY
jgi:hypothetical protein